MKLSEKGRYVPAPTLEPMAQRVSAAVAKWAGIHARTHWMLGDERQVDGADFYFGQEEVGHIHLDSEAHIFVGRQVAETLVKAGLARRFPWSRDAVMFPIRHSTDVAHALWLFELSYERRRGGQTSELLARVASYRQVTGVDQSAAR